MANTYSQIYVQIIFAVQGRHSLISKDFREPLEKYICGIISNKKSKPQAIYYNPDQTHVLIGLHPSISISDMARDIKANSSKWIKENKFIKSNFSWQVGFGAFTYSKSQIDSVVKYILNQPEHHKKTTFKDEYISFLKNFQIEYHEDYLFEFYE